MTVTLTNYLKRSRKSLSIYICFPCKVHIYRFTISIEYELYVADDYGEPDDEGNWNGLIGELHNRRADIGIGAISVMAERESVVDFTVSYYDLVGISILMKTIQKSDKLKFKLVRAWDSFVSYLKLPTYNNMNDYNFYDTLVSLVRYDFMQQHGSYCCVLST